MTPPPISLREAPCRFGPVNWDPSTNEVTPVEDPLALLNPLSVIEQEIAAALQRAKSNLSAETKLT